MPSASSNSRNQQEEIEEGESLIQITNNNRSNSTISRVYSGHQSHSYQVSTIGPRLNHRVPDGRVRGAVESRFMTVFILWFKSMVVRILLGIRAFALFTSRVGTCLLLMWRSQWRKVRISWLFDWFGDWFGDEDYQ